MDAKFVDGKFVTPNSQTTTQTGKASENSKETKKAGELDKDAFLQLLVAQMKYQDPLEPTSNTEYISQYANFSELEQMQNMSANLSLSRASETVGKEVIIEAKGENGELKTVQGYVEKVVYNGTKAYLSVDGTLYSIDDLKEVIDEQYLAGSNSVEKIKNILDKLPKIENLTMNDVSDVVEAYNLYGNLSEYQLSLLSKDTEEILKEYVNRANELMAAALTEDNDKPSTEENNVDDNKDVNIPGEPEDV